ncbi:MAG: hypothetical protein QXS81_00415 [Candidatus Micrarchaeaceae archaeon]
MQSKFHTTVKLIVLVFLILLIPFRISSAVSYNLSAPFCVMTGTNIPINDCIAATLPIAFIAILLSLAIVALAYTIGKLVEIEGFNRWWKTELYEVFKSILILVSIFSVIAILSGFAAGFIASPSSNVGINIAYIFNAISAQYLQPELENANNAFMGFFGVYEGLSFLKSTLVSYYLPLPIIPFYTIGSIDSGFSSGFYNSNVVLGASNGFFSDFMDIILIPSMLILQVQNDILFDLVIFGLGVLLPIGIFLRAMPFLRPLGGSILALSMTISIIYPMLLLFFNFPVSTFLAPIPTVSPSTYVTTCSNSGILGFLSTLMDDAFGFTIGIISSVSTVGSSFSINGVTAASNSLWCIYPVLNFITSPIYTNLILQFILFIFDLIIAIVIAQDIARAFGGSLRFGIGRLRLV